MALTRQLKINIKPSRTEEFTDNKRLSLARNVMYVKTDNKVVLDSFTWLDEGLFIFQFTNAETQDIKQSLLAFFKEYVIPSPSPSSRKFLSIIEPDQTLKCLQPRNVTLHK